MQAAQIHECNRCVHLYFSSEFPISLRQTLQIPIQNHRDLMHLIWMESWNNVFNAWNDRPSHASFVLVFGYIDFTCHFSKRSKIEILNVHCVNTRNNNYYTMMAAAVAATTMAIAAAHIHNCSCLSSSRSSHARNKCMESVRSIKGILDGQWALRTK